MPATTIHACPALEDFVPLADYETQTPESFADGKPVLHLHVQGATVSVPESQCIGLLGVLASDTEPVAPDAQVNGQAAEERLVQRKVDIFVTSASLTVFSHEVGAGFSILYPSIALHGIKDVDGKQAVWMQLEFADGGVNDDEFTTVELTVVPGDTQGSLMRSPAQQLYHAMSSCSELHPNPDNDDEDGECDIAFIEPSAEHDAVEGLEGIWHGSSNGGLPPPMPGSAGWMTADNVHEFFDGEGNWLGRDGELGEGAGRSRPHDELEPGGADGADGDQDTKRPRVDE